MKTNFVKNSITYYTGSIKHKNLIYTPIFIIYLLICSLIISIALFNWLSSSLGISEIDTF